MYTGTTLKGLLSAGYTQLACNKRIVAKAIVYQARTKLPFMLVDWEAQAVSILGKSL